VVDGSDFFAVHEAAGEAISRARAGGGPTLLECKTVRFFGHFEGDAQTYRGENEVENARVQRDPLTRFEEQATAAGLVSEEALRAIDDEVAALIDEAVEQARAAPEPQAADLLTDVYINY
jgi:acetoin:2,6-dichlorophenolindophenol oxidoreductase subunit alpha